VNILNARHKCHTFLQIIVVVLKDMWEELVSFNMLCCVLKRSHIDGYISHILWTVTNTKQ
jgi:hypothetical protein